MVYMIKFSRWRANITPPKHDDFYDINFVSERRTQLFDFILNKYELSKEILYLEFGVYFGRSFKWWLENNKNENSRFHGFDTFEGLPESWDVYQKGDMTTSGKIPEYDDKRYKFHKGLFQETLPNVISEIDKSKRFVINLDADLYSSTMYVLTSLAPYLKKGDIIIFDEFGVPTHEFKAYLEFTSSFYIDMEIIAASNNYYQAAFIIS